jgi:hypothetical protein
MRLALALVALWCGQALAAEEVRIVTAADAAQVCDLLGGPEAAGKIVAVELAGFRLTPWDKTRGELTVDQSQGFSTPAGLELVEGGLVAPVVPQPPRLPMRIPATADEALQLVALHKSGALRLEIWFRPPADGPACARVHRGQISGIRFATQPLAFAIRQGNRVVVRGETPEYAALNETEQPVVEPVVSVGTVLVAKGGPAPPKVTRAAMALAPALVDCYRAGLAKDPLLRGSLVAGIVIDKDGRVSEARLEMDALGVPVATRCALDSLRAARFPRGIGAVSVPVKFAGR